MRRLTAALAAALAALVGGCLSSPEPNAGDDAGVDGPIAAGLPFPGDHIMDIRDVQTLDYDGDSVDDLAISNAPDVPAADRGIFLLRGGQPDPNNLEYHVFVNTTVKPLDFRFQDLVGNNDLLDLIVLGPEMTNGPQKLEVFAQVAQGEFELTGIQSPDSGIMDTDEQSPNLLAVVAYNDALVNDIVVADLNDLFVFVYDDPASEISIRAPIRLGRDGTAAVTPFESINGILTRPTPGAMGDDLVIIENQDANWLRNDGAGVFTNAASENNGAAFFMFTASEATVTGQDSVLGGSDGSIGGFRLTQGSMPSIGTLNWPVNELPTAGFSELLTGSLDSQAPPEVVVVDGAPDLRVRVFRNVNLTGSNIGPAGDTPLLLPGLEPGAAVIADFDNDDTNEVWVFRRNLGTAACARFYGNTFRICD